MNIREILRFMYSGLDITNISSKNLTTDYGSDLSNVEGRKVYSISSKKSKSKDSDSHKVSDVVIVSTTRCITFIIALIILCVVYLSVNKIEVPCFVEQILIAIATSSSGIFLGILATLYRIPTELLKFKE